MGWTVYDNLPRAEIIRRLTKTDENETHRHETIKHCLRGNVMWAVIEITYKPTNQVKRLIGCYLLQQFEGKRWGFKDISEAAYPPSPTCPLSYLDMTLIANTEWRKEVRAYHERLNRNFEIGQKVKILDSPVVPWVVIETVKPLRGEYQGAKYRLPRNRLGKILAA